MSYTPIELYNDGIHKCLMFSDLSEGEGVQSNQFLLVDAKDFALIDPGGDLSYSALALEISKRYVLSELTYIFASHQDPDIISSLDRWLLHTQCQIVAPRIWSRFLPHLASEYVNQTLEGSVFDRIIAVPDEGMSIPFGGSKVLCLPAHFLHSAGNIQFYDPISKILFSGDLGASMIPNHGEEMFVNRFDEHIPLMEGFHKRYMTSNKACRMWAKMIRHLDIEWVVPQHGKIFKGKENIDALYQWIEGLECGVDLLQDQDFSIPEW